jgi:DNA replication and repair protein RecF
MYLKHLSLTNFRNFARLDLDMPRRVVVLVGSNAQGKTSLLEAVYFMAAFTSFQTHADRQLVNFIAAREARKQVVVGRLVADFERGNSNHRLEARLILEPTGVNGSRLRKEVLLDGVKRSLSEVIGQFNAVVFRAANVANLRGRTGRAPPLPEPGPGADGPFLCALLSEYSQALSQRNALLKALNERGPELSKLVHRGTASSSGSGTKLWPVWGRRSSCGASRLCRRSNAWQRVSTTN